MALVEVSPGSGSESKAQRCLAEALPNDWIVTTNIQSHNFEDWGLSGRGDADSIVISPRGIFVLEFKNWRGASIIPNKNKAWVVDVLIRSAGSPGRTWQAYHAPHELIDLARTMMPRSLTQR
jgi:Nuclease-related domain